MADKKRESREVDLTEWCGDKVCYCGQGCDKPSSDISVKVSADVGEAITGFKALQRELRETTKAARELEQAYEDVEKAFNKNACAVCGGSGFVSIGEGIRGVKKCDACRKGTSQ